MVTRPEADGVRIFLLGGFRVCVGVNTIDDAAWRLRKARNLIKLLALARGHRLHREQVVATLWPDLALESGLNNLHQIMHMARRALAPVLAASNGMNGPANGQEGERSGLLRIHDHIVTLDPPVAMLVDVEAFEQAAARASGTADIAAHEAALRLYTGELLPDDRYEEWTVERRDALTRRHVGLLFALAQLHGQSQDLARATETLHRLLAADPTYEDAHTGLMRLYATMGQRHQALRQFQILQTALREIDAEPQSASVDLHNAILSDNRTRLGLPLARPSLGAARRHRRAYHHGGMSKPERRGNLPASLSTFVGRERELSLLKSVLLETRLLTLIGPAGSGKTRLALQLASALSDAYPDGAWWVDLQALADPSLVSHTTAAELGVLQQPGQDIEDALAEGLRDRRALLVLHNCEHLLAACARVAETLLRGCPHLQVLVTSRERLGVIGETRWPVPPLSVPPQVTALSPEEARGFEAVRLFESRSRALQSGFAITSSNVETVAEICRRLDGLPLAIELAAARTHLLSVDQIRDRLSDHLRVSATPGPTPHRYATLGEAIDWSYRLLSDAERTLFNRVAVFAGSFAPEAAHEICGDGGASTSTLDLLSSLVERSMVVLVETPKGEIRYRLLETLRQFALERFREADEEAAMVRRRRDFFLRLAEQATTHELRGPRQADWLDRLELDLDNFRETLARCRSEPDGAEPMLRLVVAPQIFWMVRGHYHEARRWIEAALALNGHSPSTLRADALLAVGGIAQLEGDIVASRESREEALRVSRALGDLQRVGATLRELGWWYQDRGDYAMARSLHEESLDTHRRIGHRTKTFLALRALGWIELDQGNYAEARALLDESVRICREIGHVAGVAVALRPLGWIAQDQGDYETARALHEASLATFREQCNPGGIAISLYALGRVAQRTGDPDTARALYEESLGIFRRCGNPWGIGRCLCGLGSVAGLTGDYATAATSLEESLRIFRGLSFTQGIGFTLCALGKVARHQGHSDRAAALFTEALSSLRRIPDRTAIAECLEGYAGVAAAQKQFTRAARLLGAAAALRDAIGAPVPPCDRPDYDRVDTAVRRGLTDSGFAAEWNRGRKMSLDQAIEFTSAVADPGGR